MHRRDFLKYSTLLLTMANTSFAFADPILSGSKVLSGAKVLPDSKSFVDIDSHIKDRLLKTKLFDSTFNDDVMLEPSQLPTLATSLGRLKKLQSIVGYANFSLLNFDDAIKISKAYSKVGAFSKEELLFLEMIFYSHVEKFGFLGEKPIKNLTSKIHKKNVKKIPYTGNYLYRGKPIEMYTKITKKIGKDVVLTSGVRSIMKQFYLFLNKAKKSRGNLSMASRSLAPPGYSFHGVGDFDVGKKGYGIHNFTERFTKTDVYKKLADLGYIKFRYERDNDLGVRFEPWHVEVV
ncbi:MAG: M15 family metallopeptidase [Desulfobacula sp.]|nr:M15 family metallopeptidase [Desulfobacula sp.]